MKNACENITYIKKFSILLSIGFLTSLIAAFYYHDRYTELKKAHEKLNEKRRAKAITVPYRFNTVWAHKEALPI